MITEEHTRCMASQSYFLKTLISGEKKILQADGAGDFLHLEEQVSLAPVIQCCVTFPRMIQLCHESPLFKKPGTKWKREIFVVVDLCSVDLLCFVYMDDHKLILTSKIFPY